MKTSSPSSYSSVHRVSLAALLMIALINPSFAQSKDEDKSTKAAKVQEHRKKLTKAKQDRKKAFPKGRMNMKDAKTRAEWVRKIKDADDAYMEAVREHAKLRGLELEGEKPNGGTFKLIDFDDKGAPIYEDTMNIDAAITTATHLVRDNPSFQSAVKIEAEVAYPNNHSGVQLETTTDTGGGQNIGYIENGDWAEYTIDIPVAGQYNVDIRTASRNDAGGTINLSVNGSPIGSADVPDTNGWQTWTTVRAQVNFPTAGSQTLRMDFVGGAGYLFNFNWFSYNRSVIIGHWESGTARLTHQELSGKVTIMDGSTTTTNHATHVAGILVSRGINADTLGMAPDASIAAFNSTGAESEMMANGAAAPNTSDIHISNHSYGVTRGWRFGTSWEWRGEYTDGGNQADFYDANFGRYNSRSETWDNITYNLPYYVMFAAAGNGRENGPNTGASWTYRDGFSTVTVDSYDPDEHPLGNRYYKGHTGGYDTMEGGSLAKNSISVGSSDEGIGVNGFRDPDSATAQSYSCRGPADDGRIKPDIHGNGTDLTSSIASSDTATASYGGTSMSSPNVCGSAALLINYYRSRFPNEDMLASTLKGLILHTADDRGTDGPDYKYGWGLMNTKTAADVIKMHADGNGGGNMIESVVNNTTAQSQTHSFAWDGTSPLRVTICWTDPPGNEISGHDNRAKALVNDLNLKVTGPDGTHLPYVMPYVGDWSNAKLESAAVTGVNDVDNVEQVYLATPVAGDYTITIDYAGALTNNEQEYSLIVTGQSPAEIEVEYDGPPVAILVDDSGTENFGSAAPSAPSVVRTYTIRNTGGSTLTDLAISKTGTNAGDFTISQLIDTELEPGQTTSFTVSFDPLDTGIRTAALEIVSNDLDENIFDINLSATGLTELEAWRLTNFGNTNNTGNGIDDFDFDKDSLPNLIEFALGTDPTTHNNPPYALTLNGTTAELTYPRSVIAMGEYDYQVVWSDDLEATSWSDSSVTESILSDNGIMQSVKAEAPVGNASKRFFRIEVTPK